jgi:lipopolysaccharide/colanic/teichoic acid biosynthesis glycosyltransferase
MSALQYAQPVVVTAEHERRPASHNNYPPAEIDKAQRALFRFPHHGLQVLPAAGAWINSRRRRVLDFAVAAAVLVALAPLFLLVALLVRLSSPGPVFFRQRRMGRHGAEFTLYKFRSMHVSDASGSPITVIGDSRITRIGVILRRYKLDELPQFWNVLKGDMSLVGPRPKLPQHEALFLYVRPGITGAATLAFRQEEEVLAGIPRHQLETFYQEIVKPSKAWIDSEYIAKATFRSDLRLLSETCTACLGISSRRSTREWISIYASVRASYGMPVDVKLSA